LWLRTISTKLRQHQRYHAFRKDANIIQKIIKISPAAVARKRKEEEKKSLATNLKYENGRP
jgi:hypothetical protein